MTFPVIDRQETKEPNNYDYQQQISPHVEEQKCSGICTTNENTLKINHAISKLYSKEVPGINYVEEYLRDKQRKNLRTSTILQVSSELGLFLTFLKRTGLIHLEQLSKEDLDAFVENELDRGIKTNTIRTRLVIIYTFIKFLIASKIVHPGLIERKIHLKLPDYLPRAINVEDIKLLIDVVKNIRNRAAILLLLRTGMRIGELLNSKVDDINFADKKIIINEGVKNRRGRVVYFSGDAGIALKAWINKRDKDKEYLFHGLGRRAQLTYSGARKMFNTYMNKAGLLGKGYTLHCLRHTYATELLNAGMRLECLQYLLGHSNIEITMRYARLSDKTREREYFKAMTVIEREG